ncbi:sigma-70 family RNA polymerase sigma factor [Chryseolinea lacunae]|nr:sigma-70 family RNA polymerase sigma factor [Chryseolinea lacunae]
MVANYLAENTDNRGVLSAITSYLYYHFMSRDQAITLYQPMLHAIAYNIVRCKEDAEDIVQETFLKWLSLGPKKVEDTRAYLIKAVRNNCLNHISTLRHKKEELLNQHTIAEIIGRFKETSFAHLDLDVELDKAMKVLHTKLEPLERAVYLLKEVFDFDYEALQETLDKKKDHCRQLLCRAKKKLSDETAKLNFELPDTSKLMDSFRKACDFGNAADLIQELKNDVSAAPQKKS